MLGKPPAGSKGHLIHLMQTAFKFGLKQELIQRGQERLNEINLHCRGARKALPSLMILQTAKKAFLSGILGPMGL